MGYKGLKSLLLIAIIGDMKPFCKKLKNMAKNNSIRNNYQQTDNGTKLITTAEQNTFDGEIENDLFSGGLGEYLLFGSKEEQLLIDDNEDILNGNEEKDQLIDAPDDDILTEGGGTDPSVFDSFEKEVEVIRNFDEIIDKIQLHGESFDLEMSEQGLSNKFNFDSSKGILSYEGREILIINSYDGSVEIATGSELV